MDALLTVRGLSKSFLEGDRFRPVLREVTLDLFPGEFVALLGPSGSGKSTLLNLVSGIDAPDEGSIRLGETELTALSERGRALFRRRRLGLVFQFFNLIPTLTVLENLLLPLELNGMDEGRGRARAERMLERMGLGDRGEAFPDRLSGGEQQRVALVRGLIHDPVLLLADEPTGNLDASSGARVLDLMDELMTENDRTVLVATHSVDVASRAHRVLELEDGRLRKGD